MDTYFKEIVLKNERCAAVDQAIDLAALLPEGDKEREGLLRTAVRVYGNFFAPIGIVIRPEVETEL